jgi:hypothetical protein
MRSVVHALLLCVILNDGPIILRVAWNAEADAQLIFSIRSILKLKLRIEIAESDQSICETTLLLATS